ncbi:porin [Paraburkholderia xenovorans]
MNSKVLVLIMSLTMVGTAHAQSRLTLYGLIDEGLLLSTNSAGGRQYEVQSDVMQPSRWGIRGTEELGSGMQALFVLENGFDPSSGKLRQGGLEFGRQAYVGVSSTWGTVTLGRQYDSVVDFLSMLSAAGQFGGSIVAHAGDADNFISTARINNSIKYTSDTYGGFTFDALYSFGGIAGDVSRNQIYSFGAGYTRGPLAIGVAFLTARNPNIGFWGTSTPGTATPTTVSIASPIFSGFASAHNYQNIAAAGTYSFGALTIGMTYSNVEFKGLGDLGSGPYPSAALHYSGEAILNNAEFSVRFRMNPALLIGAAYDYTNVSSVNGQDGARYNQFEVGADYYLSKRTDVYVVGVYQKSSGTNSLGAPAVAAVYLLAPSSNDKQGVVRIGIRHKF